MDSMNFQTRFSALMERSRRLTGRFEPKGLIVTDVIREGRIIARRWAFNDVVTDGKNYILNSFFTNVAPPALWYHGLITSVGFSALAATDVMSSHTGWAEFTTYNETPRPTWTPTTSTAGSNYNASAMQFTINAAGTLQGGFITSNSTIGGTTGILWATALYGSPIVVAIGDVIRNTYGISC